ncbi:armadillo-type protein [Epithele typhae]|uniref:armadillo-type protein n=1 Tax=Epithele typhae TaxID=378194 RepID=UPI002007F362|nr:armadillo-type protein [Epithele typhae]KAH9923163.1 armadillo-type protein [Epithele typhae]
MALTLLDLSNLHTLASPQLIWTLSLLLLSATGVFTFARSSIWFSGAPNKASAPTRPVGLRKHNLGQPRPGVANAYTMERELTVPFPIGEVRVSSLLVHPIKSCRGTLVAEARYGPEGLENDRKWCIIQASSNEIITARDTPNMVLITPHIEINATSPYGGKLVVSFPEDSGCETFSVPLNVTQDIIDTWPIVEECTVHGFIIQGIICSSIDDKPRRTPSEILSQYFKKPVHLVMKGPKRRRCPPTTAFPDLDESSLFQDAYPFLVASEESLEEVTRVVQSFAQDTSPEARIGGLDRGRWSSGMVPMERFRPNIVLKGSGVPFAEDMWRRIVLRPSQPSKSTGTDEARTFTLVSKCTRCLLPNVDPSTGMRDAAVPYKVLLKFRRKDPTKNTKSCFGCNAIVGDQGIIRVGDRMEAKTQIRQAVFQGLSDPLRKIRSLCARVLSSIANCDWPDEYPDLLTSLLNLLSSGSSDSVHGAMQLFTEFIKADLTEDQILPVLRQLLPVLLNILGAPQQHSPLTRARTLDVFRQCVEALYMVKNQYPDAVKEAVSSVLPVWLDAFRTLLNSDPRADVENTPNWDGLAIRIQVFKSLDTIHTSFPRALTPYLKDLLDAALVHLSVLFPTFSRCYLQSGAAVPASSEDETIELTHLVCPMLDFVNRAARSGRATDWFEGDNLSNLVGGVFSWVQMTKDDEEEWANNANAFVAQDSDETLAYSVRMAGFELLSSLVGRRAAAAVSAFQSTIQRVVGEAEQTRNAGSQEWWRTLEAALAAIGAQAEDVLEALDDERLAEREKPIDIESLLTNVVPSFLVLSQFPFLQGRAFVFASQYARLLPPQYAAQYLDAAVQVLESAEAGVPVKVSAVKAIHNFCQNIDDAVSVHMAARIAKDIGPFLAVTSEDTLTLVLETLAVVVQIDDGKWITKDLAQALVAAVLDVWMKNNKGKSRRALAKNGTLMFQLDPIFVSILTDVLGSLASSPAPGIYQTVVQQALPALCNAIASSATENSWISSAAIELITSLVEGASDGALGEGFFATLAPSLFGCLAATEDRDCIQNGIVCLTLITRKDIQQIVSWSDATTSQSGLDMVLQVIAKQLQSEDESGGLVIGDLIIHLLRRAGESVLPVLPQLLEAMVRRMRTAKTATFLQVRITFITRAHAPSSGIPSELLENMSVDGTPALEVFVRTWCENAETFQGYWPPRISTLALCACFANARPSLQGIIVKGDIIVKPETKNVIMTRSRTKQIPTEFTSVPFPVKAIKLLLRELQTGGEAPHGLRHRRRGRSRDEEWTAEEKLYQGFKADEFALLSDMLGPRGAAFDNDDALDVHDDEDLKADPVSTMDMRAHLLGFLRESGCCRRW